jgi:ATP-binding protein involved in chromosome partitioning
MVPVTGAIIVSTPQNVALADARKGIAMFRMNTINVPVLGLVENMAYFTPVELPENKYYIFGKDGAKNLAEKLNIPLLGQIPLVQSICEGGDSGQPAALDENSPTGKAFMDLAKSVAQQIAIRNATSEPTKKVEAMGF